MTGSTAGYRLARTSLWAVVYTAKNSLRNINPCKERPPHAKSIIAHSLSSPITNKV